MKNLKKIANELETFALSVGLPAERRAKLLELKEEILKHTEKKKSKKKTVEENS